MAEIILGWKILLWLGAPILINSYLMAWRVRFLDVDFGQAPMPFKITMYFLSCVVLLIGCIKGVIGLFHSIQRWRELKLKNDLFAKTNGLWKEHKKKWK